MSVDVRLTAKLDASGRYVFPSAFDTDGKDTCPHIAHGQKVHITVDGVTYIFKMDIDELVQGSGVLDCMFSIPADDNEYMRPTRTGPAMHMKFIPTSKRSTFALWYMRKINS
jgi:hypothetical protein